MKRTQTLNSFPVPPTVVVQDSQTEMAFPHSSVGKESACNTGDLGSIPGLGKCPGEGNGYLVQYACLENPMDRGAWQAWGPKELDTNQQLLFSLSAGEEHLYLFFKSISLLALDAILNTFSIPKILRTYPALNLSTFQ